MEKPENSEIVRMEIEIEAKQTKTAQKTSVK